MKLNLSPIGAILDLVPSWVYAAAIAGLLSLNGWQWGEVQAAHVETAVAKSATAAAKGEVSKLQAQDALDKAERERVARIDAEQVAKAQFRAAEITQENSNESAKRATARAVADRKLADDNQRLRNVVEAYAGSGGGEAAPDAATCRRDADHAARLGELVEEALDLSRESESFIRQRDDEVRRLQQQIATDRQAVDDAAK